jgi:NAD(P) transhydrogenase subunit alpha
MLPQMNPGAVIMDISIDQGGNCDVTEAGKNITRNNIVICGIPNIPGRMAIHASFLYANNIYFYVENLFKKGLAAFDLEDEIVRHSIVTYRGEIVFKGALKAMGKSKSAGLK